LERRVTVGVLAQVQKRREFPVQVTQWLQVNAHNQMYHLFQNPGPFNAPWQARVVLGIPGVTHLIGRMVGMGVRPEHVQEPKKAAKPARRAPVIAVFAGIAAAVIVVAVVRLGRGR
jgi:hypothetical protein